MSSYLLPVLFAIGLWWSSTGVVLLLDRLPARTFRGTLVAASALAVIALYGLSWTAHEATVTGAYLAFVSAIAVWGWIEITFLTGVLTGPRQHACPAGCSGPAHFWHAVQAILYHEFTIIALALAVFALTADAPNRTGLSSFLVLWIMRQSAKLNLHLGVRNLSEEFLPGHLRYLQSFFRRRPMNLLFPLSVTAATVALVLLVLPLTASSASPFAIASGMLVASLLGLAIIEHWFLVLPLPATALWNWGLHDHDKDSSRSAPPADGTLIVTVADRR